MHRRLVATCAIVCLLGATSPAAMAAKAPDTWDGLTKVKAKRFDAVYLLPSADFREYSKIMLDPTEVAFRKNWVRDYNNSTSSLGDRISQSDADKMLANARRGFEEIFRKAHADAGYQIVTEPGPDVLRVRTAVVNLYANAPVDLAGRSRSYSEEAGGATLIVELRDSSTGALLGRAVDGKLAGDTGPYLRSEFSNRNDFRDLFKDWAKISIDGLALLKSRSPGATP
jgi:hypothetical protein